MIQKTTQSSYPTNSLIKLRSGTPLNAIPSPIQRMMENLPEQGYVWITHKKWVKNDLPQYLQYVEQWLASSLRINYNQHETMIRDIEGISFRLLGQIHLDNNNITSVETLCRVDMPNIHTIYLSYNQLSSIKPLRKCRFEKLDILSICQNRILDWQHMSLISLPKEMTNISFFYHQKRVDERSFFKIQPKYVNRLIDLSSTFYNVKQIKRQRFSTKIDQHIDI